MVFTGMKAEIVSKFVLCLALQLVSGTTANDCPAKCSCLNGGTIIDCSGKNLNSIPTLPVTAKSVDLSNNKISSITKNDFRSLRELVTVNLTSNVINTIDDLSFSDANILQHLYLGNNQLTKVPALAVKSLRTIILNGNLISEFPFNTFPDSWYNCNNLTTVGLADNKFTMFHSTTFMGLEKLPVKNVDISSNKLLKPSPFDPSLFLSLPKLESLDLSFNALTAKVIHDALITIRNPLFKALNVAGTNIVKLDANFFETLTNLEDLNMSKCKLAFWDVDTFTKTPKLTKMDLSDNDITTIHNSSYDNSFNGIEKSLKNVKLGNNPFQCYCSLMWLRELMDSKSLNITDKDTMKCAEPESLKGQKVLTLTKENCVSRRTTPRPITTTTPKPTTTTSNKPTTTTPKPTTTTSNKPTTTTPQPNTTTSHKPTTTTPKPTTTTSHKPTTTTPQPNTTTSHKPTTTTLKPNTTTVPTNTTTSHKPTTTTAQTPVTTSSSNSTVIPTTSPHGKKGGFPGWGIALICLIIIGLIIAGFFSYRHWRRRQMDDEGRLPIIGDPVA